MKRRKLIGGVAFGLLLLLGWTSRHVSSISQDNWAVSWKLVYSMAVAAAFFATFYDRTNLPKNIWNFNPRRGLRYFIFGWIIFPIMIGVNAVSATNFSLSGMLLGTLALSVFVGIAGTFTENVGV